MSHSFKKKSADLVLGKTQAIASSEGYEMSFEINHLPTVRGPGDLEKSIQLTGIIMNIQHL